MVIFFLDYCAFFTASNKDSYPLDGTWMFLLKKKREKHHLSLDLRKRMIMKREEINHQGNKKKKNETPPQKNPTKVRCGVITKSWTEPDEFYLSPSEDLLLYCQADFYWYDPHYLSNLRMNKPLSFLGYLRHHYRHYVNYCFFRSDRK